MRGLIPAHFMSRIEDVTGLRMAEMVDVFSGPSTGAILNAALTLPHKDTPMRPKYRARHLVRFYEREGLKIFPQDRFREMRGLIHDFNNRTMKIGQLNALFRHGHYDPKNLRKALRALYGRARLKDSLRSLIVPFYNIDGEQLELVEESGESGDAPVHTQNNFIDEGGHAVWLQNVLPDPLIPPADEAPDVQLYDAVTASCAAPTFFPCHHFSAADPVTQQPINFTGIDGVIFDNPCISYMGAIRRFIPKDHKLIMIVLGTGYTNKSIKKDDWNQFGALGVVDPVNDLPLINILFHASESALIDSFSEEMGKNLYIFNKTMINCEKCPSTQIDDASPENLGRMKSFMEEIIEDDPKTFDHVCHLLVKNRDDRLAEKESLWKKISRTVYFIGR